MSLTRIVKLSRNFQKARLREFADNDPAVIERLVQETKDALEATNRWIGDGGLDNSEQSIIWLYGNISCSPVIMPGGREPLSQVDGQHLLYPGVGEEEVSLD